MVSLSKDEQRRFDRSWFDTLTMSDQGMRVRELNDPGVRQAAVAWRRLLCYSN